MIKMKLFHVRSLSRLGASPGYVTAPEPGLAPKRLRRLETSQVIFEEMDSLDAEAAEVLETIRGLV